MKLIAIHSHLPQSGGGGGVEDKDRHVFFF